MINLLPFDFHDEKLYSNDSLNRLTLVRKNNSHKTGLLRSFYSNQNDQFESVNRLYSLKIKRNLPNLIPSSMTKHQMVNETHYYYENFTESLEEAMNMKLLENSYFSFAEIYHFFTTLINGLAFLQLNNYTIRFNPQKLFLTSKRTINCIEIEGFSKENLDKEMHDFGLLLIQMSTLKFPHSLKENYEKVLITDNLMMEEVEKSLEIIEERYRREISIQEDKIGLNMFLKTLRTIFFRKNKKRRDYVSLFIDTLYLISPNTLESLILKIDSRGSEESIKDIDSFVVSSNRSIIDSNSPVVLEEIPKFHYEKYVLSDESNEIKIFGRSSKGYIGEIGKDKLLLNVLKEIKPIYSINVLYNLKEDDNLDLLYEVLKSFKSEINPYPHSVIFSNHMNEKLNVQAPWANFLQNVYWRKICDNVSDEGIRWIIEHNKDWNCGMNDDQMDGIFTYLENFVINPFLEKFTFYVQSYFNITMQTIVKMTFLLQKASFENLREFELGFEIKEFVDKNSSILFFKVLHNKITKIPNSLEVFSFILATYYSIDHIIDILAEIILSQQKLIELNFFLSYITANITKTKFMDLFNEKNLQYIEKISIGFYSWHYSNYFADGSFDLFINKMQKCLPVNMKKVSILFSSGGVIVQSIASIVDLLKDRIIDVFNIFLQGYSENNESSTELKSKIENILKENNPKIVIESSLFNFTIKNKFLKLKLF